MKKLLCIALTVTLVIGMAVSASAAVIITNGGGGPGPVITNNPTSNSGSGGVVTSGIKAINESSAIGDLSDFDVTINDDRSNTMTLDDLSDLEVAPGDVIKIPLSGVLFLDRDGYPFGDQPDVSLSALNSANIGVRSSFTRGEGAYSVSLEGNRNGSYIRVEFNEGLSLDAQKFTSSIYLTKNGSRKSSTRIVLKGHVQTPVQELRIGDDYADISDGSFVYAKSSLRDVELYLGEYCTITRNLIRGQSYAGIATTDDIDGNDMVTLNKYSEIQYIYKLKTVGLKTTGNIVTFDLSRKYYVYNSNGQYIGMSNQELPYWTKYYLSTKKYSELTVKAKIEN